MRENSGFTSFSGSAGRCDVSEPLQTNLYKNTEIRHLPCCFCLSILQKLIQHVLFRPIVWTCGAIIWLAAFLFKKTYSLIGFLLLCLYKIVMVLCFPIRFIAKQCLKLLPVKMRLTFRRYFEKGAGFLKRRRNY